MPNDTPRWEWPMRTSRDGMLYLGPASVAGEEVSLFARLSDVAGGSPRPALFVRDREGMGSYVTLFEGAPGVGQGFVSRYGGCLTRQREDYFPALKVAVQRARARGLYAR